MMASALGAFTSPSSIEDPAGYQRPAATYSVGCLARFGAASEFATTCVAVAGLAPGVDFDGAVWALACLTLASCFAWREGSCAIDNMGHSRQTASELSTIFFIGELLRRLITKTAVLSNSSRPSSDSSPPCGLVVAASAVSRILEGCWSSTRPPEIT